MHNHQLTVAEQKLECLTCSVSKLKPAVSDIPRGASRTRQDTKERAMHLKVQQFHKQEMINRQSLQRQRLTTTDRHTTESSYSKQAEQEPRHNISFQSHQVNKANSAAVAARI
jgi:hypothetical protein